VAFGVERFLALGAYSKIAALWVILIVLAVVGGILAWLTPALAFDDLGEAAWWALLRLSDPGYLADDNATGVRLLSIVLTMLGLALYVGVLIAIITQGFTERMERLALGMTPVRFTGHVAVVGWTNRTLELVAELLEFRETPPRVVVLVEHITAEIEQSLRDRLPRRLRRRVVLRTGDPERLEGLARIRGHSADVVVLPGADRPDGDAGSDDPRVLKVIASLDKTAGKEESRPRIIAEIVDVDFIPVAEAAYPGPLQMVPSEVLVGRSLAMGIRAPGLSLSLADLVDVRAGRALRVERLPSLAGERLVCASVRLPTAILLGALRGAGEDRHLESDPDTRLEENDSLLLLAPIGATIEPLDAPPEEYGAPLEPGELAEPASTRRVLVLGWSGKVRELCRELTDEREQPLEIDVVSRQDPAARESRLAVPTGVTVRHIVGDQASPGTYTAIDPCAYDCVAVVGSEYASNSLEADSRTITAVLLVLNRLEGTAARPHVIAEILEPANRAVLEDRNVELVVTPELVARVLVGGFAHPELAEIFSGMVEGRLGRLGVISLAHLVAAGATTFGAFEWGLRRKGIVCLGLQREVHGFVPELVPDKREPLRIGPHDRALVAKARA
jgi:Trk K+ transport system NAD-binding subunit